MTDPLIDSHSAHARRRRLSAAALLGALAALGPGARVHACASCGCTLSADAAMGYSAIPGWRLSIEYDYVDQEQLRSGTHTVSGVPAGTELENQTIFIRGRMPEHRSMPVCSPAPAAPISSPAPITTRQSARISTRS